MERSQLDNMRQSLLDEGSLGEQFVQLEKMQDDDSPDFVEEVVNSFFMDSEQSVQNIEQGLEMTPMDFSKLGAYMHKMKGSCLSIGAKKLKDECLEFRNHCNAEDEEGCKRAFQQFKEEYVTLKQKLDAYFQLAKQIGSGASTSSPK